MRFFLFVIERADPGGAFEQHVFEVVRQAGGFGRVVLAAGAHGDLRLEPRRLVVLRQVNPQAVVHLVNLDGHRVLRIRWVDSFEAGPCGNLRGENYHRDGDARVGYAVRCHGLTFWDH